MLQGTAKKVDGLVKRETTPILSSEKEKEFGLALQPEIKPEFKPKAPETPPIEPLAEAQSIVAPMPVESAKPAFPSLTKEQVEHILAEDLESVYGELPKPLQEEFKAKGEETAVKITLLMQKAKVKIREIINLIKKWLKTIPGINKFFLEQEAKIKADKIMALQLSAR